MEKRAINWRSSGPVIFAISGSGNRAGKTTFARSLSSNVFSLANALRDDLVIELPQYDWYNKDGVYKDTTIVTEYGVSMREVMIKYGQEKCANDANYWSNKLCGIIQADPRLMSTVAIDDVRKLSELDVLRKHFNDKVVHYHVTSVSSLAEPHFENDQLAAVADYIITWNR